MRSVLFQIGPFTAYGYGLMIAVGVFAAFWISMYRAKKNGLDDDALFNMGVVGVIGGLIGAKLLYYVVEFPNILKNPAMLFQFSEGFVVYGGLIFGFLCPYVYARIKKYPFWRYLDITVAGVAIAQGFGRIGCFLAGCCYGCETDSVIGVVFPEGSLAPAGVKLVPTQLISSAGDFLIAAVLMVAARKLKKPGMVSGLYLVLYSVGRFLIEFLRNDPRGSIGMFSTSQFIAIIMLIAGIAVMTISVKSKNSEGQV